MSLLLLTQLRPRDVNEFAYAGEVTTRPREGQTPRLCRLFALERFRTDTTVSELAAAAVSH